MQDMYTELGLIIFVIVHAENLSFTRNVYTFAYARRSLLLTRHTRRVYTLQSLQ